MNHTAARLPRRAHCYSQRPDHYSRVQNVLSHVPSGNLLPIDQSPSAANIAITSLEEWETPRLVRHVE